LLILDADARAGDLRRAGAVRLLRRWLRLRLRGRSLAPDGAREERGQEKRCESGRQTASECETD